MHRPPPNSRFHPRQHAPRTGTHGDGLGHPSAGGGGFGSANKPLPKVPSEEDFPPLPGAKPVLPATGWKGKAEKTSSTETNIQQRVVDAPNDLTDVDDINWSPSNLDWTAPTPDLELEAADSPISPQSASYSLRTPSTLAPLTPSSPVFSRFRSPRLGAVNMRSLFVGGLNVEVDAWDEERLRTIFEPYGTVTNVQLIIPREFHFRFPMLDPALITLYMKIPRSLSPLLSLRMRMQLTQLCSMR